MWTSPFIDNSNVLYLDASNAKVLFIETANTAHKSDITASRVLYPYTGTLHLRS